MSLLVGRIGEQRLDTNKSLQWSQGMVTVALSWLAGPMFLAVPLHLSGRYGSFLDAYFDAMSGLTTSGLSVIQDLDHLEVSLNLYRHLLHFMGGRE